MSARTESAVMEESLFEKWKPVTPPAASPRIVIITVERTGDTDSPASHPMQSPLVSESRAAEMASNRFFDIGSVWSLENTTGFGGSTVDDSFNPRASIGVSVFWKTPIGPLRFNFSKALMKEDYDKEQSFELTISSQF